MKATRCTGAGLDVGVLRCLADGSICLADPAYYMSSLCKGRVSTTIVSWLQNPGYSEQAELILAPAARRLVLDGKFPKLLRLETISVLTLDSANGGGGVAANDDTSAPSLARISVVALGGNGNGACVPP